MLNEHSQALIVQEVQAFFYQATRVLDFVRDAAIAVQSAGEAVRVAAVSVEQAAKRIR